MIVCGIFIITKGGYLDTPKGPTPIKVTPMMMKFLDENSSSIGARRERVGSFGVPSLPPLVVLLLFSLRKNILRLHPKKKQASSGFVQNAFLSQEKQVTFVKSDCFLADSCFPFNKSSEILNEAPIHKYFYNNPPYRLYARS